MQISQHILYPHRAEQKIYLQKFNLVSTLQKTDLSDVCCIIILRRSSELEVEKKWRLTRRDLFHQYFPTLSARSLKLEPFSITIALCFA